MDYHKKKIEFYKKHLEYHQDKLKQGIKQDEYQCYVAKRLGRVFEKMCKGAFYLQERIEQLKEIDNNCEAWDFMQSKTDMNCKKAYAELHDMTIEELREFIRLFNKLT